MLLQCHQHKPLVVCLYYYLIIMIDHLCKLSNEVDPVSIPAVNQYYFLRYLIFYY